MSDNIQMVTSDTDERIAFFSSLLGDIESTKKGEESNTIKLLEKKIKDKLQELYERYKNLFLKEAKGKNPSKEKDSWKRESVINAFRSLAEKVKLENWEVEFWDFLNDEILEEITFHEESRDELYNSNEGDLAGAEIAIDAEIKRISLEAARKQQVTLAEKRMTKGRE